MKKVVFYSWQSDLPDSTNRSFIEVALKRACQSIADDSSIQVEPVVDRDTQGVPGAPDMRQVIFNKIDSADVFVADISITNKSKAGKTAPNPNVSLELGYAFKGLGHNDVLLVMNTEYGGTRDLPFDLDKHRVISYDGSDLKTAEAKLVKEFEEHIRAILGDGDTSDPSSTKEVIDAIEHKLARRTVLVRNFLNSIIENLKALYPGEVNGREDYDEDLLRAWEQSKDSVFSFGKLIEAIAVLNDEDVLKEVLGGLVPLLEKFFLPLGFNGRFDTRDQDFYKVVGNEMFVMMISILMREQKWPLIKLVLEHHFVVENAYGRMRDSVPFTYFSQYAPSLEVRKRRLGLNRLSIRADILHDRHSSIPINTVSSDEDYLSADYLLFLKGESNTPNSTDVNFSWIPHSLVYMEQVPKFIFEAQSKKVADEVSNSLGLTDSSTLSVLVINKTRKISQLWPLGLWRVPIDRSFAEKIGSRP